VRFVQLRHDAVNIFVCIHMHACMHTCIHTGVHFFVHINMHVYMYTCMHTLYACIYCMHAYQHLDACIFYAYVSRTMPAMIGAAVSCMSAYTYPCIFVCGRAHVCIFAHTHTHRYIHMHMYSMHAGSPQDNGSHDWRCSHTGRFSFPESCSFVGCCCRCV
jgi:hypothetical protein